MNRLLNTNRSTTVIKAPSGETVLKIWQKLSALPAGKWLFALILGLAIPYSGSIRARVESLEPGSATVKMRDRRRVRNHLSSVHAIALSNLAELTSGLATLCGMPDSARGILVGLQIDYVKKARGVITGHCECQPPNPAQEAEFLVNVTLSDQSGDTVATASARWLIGPKPVTRHD